MNRTGANRGKYRATSVGRRKRCFESRNFNNHSRGTRKDFEKEPLSRAKQKKLLRGLGDEGKSEISRKKRKSEGSCA